MRDNSYWTFLSILVECVTKIVFILDDLKNRLEVLENNEKILSEDTEK